MITEYTQLILRKPQRAMGSPNAIDAWCDEAATALKKLEAENAALRTALGELIACKDLKERIESKLKMTAETERWRMDYERRKPIAWEVARAALLAGKLK